MQRPDGSYCIRITWIVPKNAVNHRNIADIFVLPFWEYYMQLVLYTNKKGTDYLEGPSEPALVQILLFFHACSLRLSWDVHCFNNIWTLTVSEKCQIIWLYYKQTISALYEDTATANFQESQCLSMASLMFINGIIDKLMCTFKYFTISGFYWTFQMLTLDLLILVSSVFPPVFSCLYLLYVVCVLK